MIKYTLKCANEHSFDSWFQNAEAFGKLHSGGMVECAVCGSAEVEKAIMAPQVTTTKGKDIAEKPLSAPASVAEQAMSDLKSYVEANSENVGTDFASEARKIHDGEAPSRSIFGEAKLDDAKKLLDDGVPVAPLPWGRKNTN